MINSNPMALDLHLVELPEDGLYVQEIPEGVALGTFSTASTASTGSCPVSSAASIMTANCQG